MNDWRLELTAGVLAAITLLYFSRYYARDFIFSKIRLTILATLSSIAGFGLCLLLPMVALVDSILLGAVVGLVASTFALATACQLNHGVLGRNAKTWLGCSVRKGEASSK